MRPIAMIRGVLGSVVVIALSSTGCSSSDTSPPTSPAAGNGGQSGSTAGKGGKAGAGKSGDGAEAGDGGATAGARSDGDEGGAAGASGSGNETSGAGEGGSGGEGSADPCAACASGQCLPSGQCVECLPSADHCPAGKYCSADDTCVSGCKNGDGCASGVCSATHDCQNCLSDSECSSGEVCGAQLCAAACTAQQEGGNPGCGTGLTCCSLHCVDTNSDNAHCGVCGTACSAAQFCGQTGCVNSQLGSVCQIRKVVVVLDGQVGDDPVGRAVGQMLVNHCPAAPAVTEVAQTATGPINPQSGQPVAGGAELIVLAGGNAVQHAAGYLNTNKVAPVSVPVNSFDLVNTSTGAVIASEPSAGAPGHVFAVQFMRDSSSGSLILNVFGFTAEGTAAASVYFEQAVLANLGTATQAWYVGKWIDANADDTAQSGEITLLASGN